MLNASNMLGPRINTYRNNKKVDFESAKKDDVELFIYRATEGEQLIDQKYREMALEASKEEEIRWGVYHTCVINSSSKAEASALSGAEQAESFVRTVAAAGGPKKILMCVEFLFDDNDIDRCLTDQELQIQHTGFKAFLVNFVSLQENIRYCMRVITLTL